MKNHQFGSLVLKPIEGKRKLKRYRNSTQNIGNHEKTRSYQDLELKYTDTYLNNKSINGLMNFGSENHLEFQKSPNKHKRSRQKHQKLLKKTM